MRMMNLLVMLLNIYNRMHFSISTGIIFFINVVPTFLLWNCYFVFLKLLIFLFEFV